MRLDVSNPRHDTTPCVSFAPRMWNETFVQHAFVRRHSFARSMPRFRLGWRFVPRRLTFVSPTPRVVRASFIHPSFYTWLDPSTRGVAWMRMDASTHAYVSSRARDAIDPCHLSLVMVWSHSHSHSHSHSWTGYR